MGRAWEGRAQYQGSSKVGLAHPCNKLYAIYVQGCYRGRGAQLGGLRGYSVFAHLERPSAWNGPAATAQRISSATCAT